MSPRSKVICAAILFSSGGAAIKFTAFPAWQLAAFRAALALSTIFVLLPEARRGWTWRTIVVGFTTASFQSLSPRLADLLRVLGAGRLRTLWILALEARGAATRDECT